MSASSIIIGANQVGTIQRKSQTRDTNGAVLPGWYDHLQNIPVFEQEHDGVETERYDRRHNRRSSVWFALPNQDIRAKDQLIVGTRTLEIVSVRDRSYNTRMGHVRLDCEENF